MHKINITEARKISERLGADGVVVIAFKEHDFAMTSYGATKDKCAALGKWLDGFYEDLVMGRIPEPFPVND